MSASSAKLQFGYRQQSETEAEDARLLAEPCAVADTRVQGGKRRMETRDGSLVELVRPQTHTAEGAGIGLDPFDQRGVALDPGRSERKTFAKVLAPCGDDRLGLGQNAQAQHLVDRRIGDHRIEFSEHHLLAQGGVADDRPADAQARRAVAFRERAGDDHARTESCGARCNRIVIVGGLTIGLVDQQKGVGAARGHDRQDAGQDLVRKSRRRTDFAVRRARRAALRARAGR